VSEAQFDKVAIVGVGLIGASIGLALRESRRAASVTGIGRRQSSLDDALQAGAIDKATTDLEQGAAGADLVVVCTPVNLIVDHVYRAVAVAPQAWVTDAASTKQRIVAELDRRLPVAARFVASHPMAGSEQSGPNWGRADLFQGQTVVIAPGEHTSPEVIDRIGQFWRGLGAQLLRMSPAQHDRVVAATSHLPHLVASLLAGSTLESDLKLAAGGWQGMTRVAAGLPSLWREILLDNRDNVLAALDRLTALVDRSRRALETGDAAELEKLLQQGKRIRDAVGS